MLGLFLDGAEGLRQGVLGGVRGLAQGILGGVLGGLGDHGDFLGHVLDRVVGLQGELVPLRAEEDVFLVRLRQQEADQGAEGQGEEAQGQRIVLKQSLEKALRETRVLCLPCE